MIVLLKGCKGPCTCASRAKCTDALERMRASLQSERDNASERFAIVQQPTGGPMLVQL